MHLAIGIHPFADFGKGVRAGQYQQNQQVFEHGKYSCPNRVLIGIKYVRISSDECADKSSM
jgi:hypothetical protein